MLHCDLKVRWKVASDLRFRAAISEPKTPSFCGISGDLAQSTRKSLAIAIVRFWCPEPRKQQKKLEHIKTQDIFWSKKQADRKKKGSIDFGCKFWSSFWVTFFMNFKAIFVSKLIDFFCSPFSPPKIAPLFSKLQNPNLHRIGAKIVSLLHCHLESPGTKLALQTKTSCEWWSKCRS